MLLSRGRSQRLRGAIGVFVVAQVVCLVAVIAGPLALVPTFMLGFLAVLFGPSPVDG